MQDDDSLNDEFTLRLRSTESINTGGRFRGTVIDDDPLATATFSRTDIKVFEGSEAQLSVRVAAPEGRSFPTQAGNQNIVRISGIPLSRWRSRNPRCRRPPAGSRMDLP